MTKNEKRDVTRILNLAKKGAAAVDLETAQSCCTQIAAIAKPMDARTGRRDPSTRKRAGSGR
jgi:hypothetical protein